MTATARRAPARRPRRSTAGWVAVIVFATLAAIGALAAVAVVGGYLVLSSGLGDPRALLANFPLQQESVVYARDGETELARFGELKREVVAFDQIPPILVDATTAVEDKTFWINSGFDPAAIVAAGVDAVRGNARGASTITQQLVRQRLLDPALVQAKGRTAERKLKEIVQSIRLTQAYPGEEGKQEIIAHYLNGNYYGNNSYGVKAAAKSYFGKELADLTLSEVALLAALPQSPSSYDLVRNAEERCAVEVAEDERCPAAELTLVVPDDSDIVRRRNVVLDLLAQPERRPLSKETYSAAEIEAAKSEDVVLAPQREQRWIAPHFVWQVREELTRELCGEDTPTCPALEQGGYRIVTTLDLKLQRAAERWVQAAALVPKAKDPEAAAERLGFKELPAWVRNLVDKEVGNGALVALDYQTGELIAYVGSAGYYSSQASKTFQPKYDVVADGWRQPGSSFKPLNYVTGIDDGTLTAATMFMDVGTDFGGGFTPSDADNLERGPLRLRSALHFSLNIPAVKALAVNKIEHVFARAEDYGVRWRESPEGLAFALGVEEIRPIDLVTAYGTLANQGRYTGHTSILKVTDADGTVRIERERPEGEQVLKPQAAAIMTDILADNTDPEVNPFWGKFAIRAGEGRRPATLKTGTNTDARDLNAYGYIPPPTEEGRAAGEYALAVGVWNGNSDNTPVSTPENPILSVDVPTYVWQGFLRQVTAEWAVNEFPVPDGLVTVAVDPWTGLLPREGGRSVEELFIAGTEPKTRVGRTGGVCGEAVFSAPEVYESRFENWMSANREWIARARRGPGVRGGPENNPTTYFYNESLNPYGRSWGPVLDGAGCGEPTPAPTCFPVPTPGPDGVVPSFAVPSPEGSGPAPSPCPTPSSVPSPSPSESAPPSEPPPTEPPPTEAPTPPPTEPPVTPPPTATPAPPPTAPPTPAASEAVGGENVLPAKTPPAASSPP